MPLVRDVLGDGDSTRERRHKAGDALLVPPAPPPAVYVKRAVLQQLFETAPPSQLTAFFVKAERLHVYVYPSFDELGRGVAHTVVGCRIATKLPSDAYACIGWLCPGCKSGVTSSIEPCPACCHRVVTRTPSLSTWL